MNRNATYLTEKYPGREESLWTPCICDFFRRYQPELPIFVRINPSNGLYYERRKHSTTIKIDGEVLQESWRDQFLPRIEAMFRSNLLDDPEKRNTIALINPDIIVIQPQRVHVIENKPYYESKFDGNQGPGGAYIAFVKWLNNNKIPCEYLLIHSSSWKEYEQVKKI